MKILCKSSLLAMTSVAMMSAAYAAPNVVIAKPPLNNTSAGPVCPDGFPHLTPPTGSPGVGISVTLNGKTIKCYPPYVAPPKPPQPPVVCPPGTVGVYPNCVGKPPEPPKPPVACPPGTVGVYPNCVGKPPEPPKPPVVCPAGTTGVYPNCVVIEKPCPTKNVAKAAASVGYTLTTATIAAPCPLEKKKDAKSCSYSCEGNDCTLVWCTPDGKGGDICTSGKSKMEDMCKKAGEELNNASKCTGRNASGKTTKCNDDGTGPVLK